MNFLKGLILLLGTGFVVAVAMPGTIPTSDQFPGGEILPSGIADDIPGSGSSSDSQPETETTDSESDASGAAPRTPLPNPWFNDADMSRENLERTIQEYVNAERKQRGLKPLNWETELWEIARYHSRDMAMKGYFDHTSPGGQTLSDRYKLFGYDCQVESDDNTFSTGGENIAQEWYQTEIKPEYSDSYINSTDEVARAVVKRWVDSEGHRENILKPYWQNAAVGVYVIVEDGSPKVYVTQNFC